MRGRYWVALGAVVVAAGCAAPAASAASPQVSETWVENVFTNSAILHARLDAGGLASTYRFDYIAESQYRQNQLAGKEGFLGAARAPQPEGNPGKGSDSPVFETVNGLLEGTSYRYRVVIGNADGTAVGPERVLTTKGGGGPLGLLDGRGWEMVSPVDKNGGEIGGLGTIANGGVFQAAAQGAAATFSSASSFGAGGGGAPVGSQYVSRRGAGGWEAENVTASGGYGEEPDGVPYQLFSTTLSAGLLSGSSYPPLPGTGAPAGYRNYYLRESAGGFAALLTHPDIAGLTMPPSGFELAFAGASPDLSQVVLSTCAALTANATEVPLGASCDPVAPNLYARSAAGWRLLNTLPGGSTGTPPAQLVAPSGAISNAGSRVFWTDGSDLYLHEEGAGTIQIDEGVGGGGTFQTASADGSVALFTKAGSLYRFALGTGTTTNLTPGGGVIGVLGASVDGASVYFLTGSGLYLSRGAGTIGPIASAADASNFPPSTATARVSADGSKLAFLSSAELTPYDNTDTASGKPVSEVYLYDANLARLTCVSCNPTGERPEGASTIPGAAANGQGEGATRAYRPRALSADGSRLFFDSGDALVSGDNNNGGQDVYEWEANGSGSCVRPEGCLQLASSGTGLGSSFVDASASGDDVFFLTGASLVKSDPGSVDLYDARVGGGFPEAPGVIPCEEDACQPLPSAPDDPTPGTLVPVPGNPPVHFPKAQKNNNKKKKKKTGHKKRRHKKGHHVRQGSRR